jgi:hypothetical protein
VIAWLLAPEKRKDASSRLCRISTLASLLDANEVGTRIILLEKPIFENEPTRFIIGRFADVLFELGALGDLCLRLRWRLFLFLHRELEALAHPFRDSLIELLPRERCRCAFLLSRRLVGAQLLAERSFQNENAASDKLDADEAMLLFVDEEEALSFQRVSDVTGYPLTRGGAIGQLREFR